MVEIPLFMKAPHCVERKHAIDVQKYHAMRIYHGNRLGRRCEMSGISGKAHPDASPMPAGAKRQESVREDRF
jgi:hypothetical protein